MSDGKANQRAKAAEAVRSFAIEAPDLPKEIEKAALTSGGFPYDEKLKRKAYDKDLRRLQIELLKLLDWVEDKGERIVIVFEGRDAAGKGGAIQRLTEHLNPRKGDPAADRASQSAQGEGCRAVEADAARGRRMVFPALRSASACQGRDRDLRPLLV